MKILVLGANGQVGFELARVLSQAGAVVTATRDGTGASLRADLADPASLTAALDETRADIIVNAAAYTAVDRAEDEAELADRINHRAVGEIGAWAARHGAGVVHYSTDYVFDGTAKRPYHEDDATAPLGVYGRSKLDGENALRASNARHLILRTAWVYAARGRNFLLTMLRLGAEREELRVVEDQVGAPTSAHMIAETTAQIVQRWWPAIETRETMFDGIHHLVAGGSCSWQAFATAILHRAVERGLIAREPRVVPITTAEYPTRARRPAYSVLDCSRLQAAFGIQLSDWSAGLDAVLDELAIARSAPPRPSP